MRAPPDRYSSAWPGLVLDEAPQRLKLCFYERLDHSGKPMRHPTALGSAQVKGSTLCASKGAIRSRRFWREGSRKKLQEL